MGSLGAGGVGGLPDLLPGSVQKTLKSVAFET
jgi:hypothetical protein